MIRKQLASWLNSGSPLAKLLEWLSGGDLPAVGDEEDPFVWILRGLPLGKARVSARRCVATRLADFFYDPSSLDTREPEVLYNALQLAGGIALPEILEAPLLQLRRPESKQKWMAELRRALTAALIRNQYSASLRADWLLLVSDGKHAFLSGNEFTGCAGVFRIPAQTGQIDDVGADWSAIGEALGIMARRLEQATDRLHVFARLIELLTQVRGDDEDFRKQILLQSFNYGWPNWAKGLVPSLWVADHMRDDVKWHLLSIPPYLFKVSWNEITKRGHIEKLRVPNSPVPLVENLFQRSLLDIPGGEPRFPHVGENLLHNMIRMEIQKLSLIGRQDLPEDPELPEIWTKTQDHMSTKLKYQMMSARA